MTPTPTDTHPAELDHAAGVSTFPQTFSAWP
jgi:hypothetical protein